MANSCYNPDINYLPCSFKGIPFEVIEATSQHGRRGAKGEFPWGESTAYADLGRAIPSYSIRGRFADNNHVAMAAALIAAVESPGPGVLVHPVRGILTVACESLRVNDNLDESAGITTFEAEFVEAHIQGNGLPFILSAAAFTIAGILLSNKQSFSARYHPTHARWYYTGNIIQTTRAGIEEIKNNYIQFTDRNDLYNRIIADFDVINNDPYYLFSEESVSRIVNNGLLYIDQHAQDNPAKIKAFRNIANWAGNNSDLEAESGMIEDAFFSFLRIAATAYLASSYLDSDPENVSAGLNDFNIITALLDQEIAIANHNCYSPFLYQELLKFRSLVQKALLDRAYKSPALVVYKFPTPVHSLVAAWALLGDAKRNREIEMRNMGHPWRVGPEIIASDSK